jgi:hypothetical protein
MASYNKVYNNQSYYLVKTEELLKLTSWYMGTVKSSLLNKIIIDIISYKW